MEIPVSVITTVYNMERYLAETIESVLTQTFQHFEFFIVDNGSTDGSAQIIRKYAAIDPRIIPIFQNNAGKCLAINNIVPNVQGKWCAFLDADDVMIPERLEKQLTFHQSNPTIDASSSHCYYINEIGQPLGTQRYPFLQTVEDNHKALKNNEVVQCAFTGLMISKQAFLKVNGLRNSFWPCEDLDLFNRLLEEKLLLINIQDCLMKYRIHASAMTAQKPRQMFDKVGWVYYCTSLRRSGQPEVTFEEYTALREQDSWWVKFSRKKYYYSQTFHRKAGFAFYSKKYMSFFWQFIMASLLAPSYVLATVLNRLKLSSNFSKS